MNFGTLFLAALFSASAGVIIKLQWIMKKENSRSDVAAICGALGALLITISGLGGFEGKWEANRSAAARMENLAYALLLKPSKKDVVLKIQRINEDRLRGIVQAGKEPPDAKPDAE